MAKDKYISMRKFVSGFSFANLGIFRGFADGVYNAVYSLVLIAIFQNSAVVGFYVSVYSVFCMIVGLFANELFRRFSKVKILYFSLLMLAACYFMMSFSIRASTFITLDFTAAIALTLAGLLIPLFMSDFSKPVGMARLNARYHLWLNVGALFAPMVAMAMAVHFGNRSAFFISAVAYLMCWLVFKYFHIVQPDKKIKKVNPRKTLKALVKNTIAFFKYPGMKSAYFVSFGYYALTIMRQLYVPILVIESGFSKGTLGWVLTLGIIPYLLFSDAVGKWVNKLGKKFWMFVGLISFAAFSVMAIFAKGYLLLVIFVLWQISGALMEPVYDLLFFDNTKKAEQSKFFGVFRTTSDLSKVVVPVLGGVCISLFGTTSSVWIVTAVIGVLAAAMLFVKK